MPILQVSKDENRQLQNIANILASSKKVVIVTGAGISTNCGVPDFRSEDGLYSLIQSQRDKASIPIAQSAKHACQPCPRKISPTSPQKSNPPTNVKGKDLFDSRIWKDPTSTSVFYTFIASLRKKIREEVKQTTSTHRFIRTMRDSRKLVRCYTQNIDGLESRLGLCTDLERGRGNRSRFTKKAKDLPHCPKGTPNPVLDGGCEVVPLHGDLTVLRCTLCQQTCGWEEAGREASLLKGKAPQCLSCALSDQQRRDRGKRGTKIGSLRPNIVLYGEEHPEADAVGSITTHDLSLAPDILLILGTSLHVQGVKTMVKEFAKCVHARPKGKGKVILVNLSKPSDSIWQDSIDYWVSMDCDEWVGSLKRHRPDIWQLQTELKAAVTKRNIRQVPKVVVESPRKKARPDKENSLIDLQGFHPTSQLRSVSWPQSKPLKESEGNSTKQPLNTCPIQDFSEEISDLMSSSQLLTPPPSSHKSSSSDRKRKRDQTLNELQECTTPTKKARGAVQAKPRTVSLPSIRCPQTQFSTGKKSKRRHTVIEIWED
ncbi:MAG: hypothetical protein Q9220_003827 [cf. Caloplaca sp. 1 TL-2023]